MSLKDRAAKRIGWKAHAQALSLIALVALVFVIGMDKTLGDPGAGPAPINQEGIGEIVATARVCQTFLARYEGLARIEVRLDNLGRENRSTFTFTLRTAPDAPEALVTLIGDAAQVGHPAYYPFRFEPLPDSGGQRYAFCLEAPEAGLQEAITAIGTLDDAYPDGEAVFRDMWGEAAGVQDLDFFLAYALSLPQKLGILGERLAAGKPFLCGGPWFYALLGATYLALLYRLYLYLVPPRVEKSGTDVRS